MALSVPPPRNDGRISETKFCWLRTELPLVTTSSWANLTSRLSILLPYFLEDEFIASNATTTGRERAKLESSRVKGRQRFLLVAQPRMESHQSNRQCHRKGSCRAET